MMGNNAVCRVIGIGNVCLKLHDRTIWEFREVRYVPNLKWNLISPRVIDKIGFSIKLESGRLLITNGSKIVMKGTKKNVVYILDEEAITSLSSVSVVFRKDKTKL